MCRKSNGFSRKSIVFFLVVLLCISLASAASLELSEKEYFPSQQILGTLNLSLQNEPINLLKAEFSNGKTITQEEDIFDFLLANNADFSCTPSDCEDAYSASNPSAGKIVSGEKLIALQIKENAPVYVDSISFDIEGNNGQEKCGSSPVKFDVLNDNENEWQYEKSGNWCGQLLASDFYNDNFAKADIQLTTTPYCEKMILLDSEKFELGAWVKNGTAKKTLTMSIYDANGNSALCVLDSGKITNEGSIVSCEADFTGTTGVYYVCISSDWDSDYKIKSENAPPFGGYFGFPSGETSAIDYSIYARASAFSPLNEKITINSDEIYNLNEKINDYLFSAYESCSAGCVIPIKIVSQQNVNISNLQVTYTAEGIGRKTADLFYDSSSEKAKITAQGLLDLGLAGFTAPSDYGKYYFEISIGDNILGADEIEVKIPETSLDLKEAAKAAINAKKTNLEKIKKEIESMPSWYSNLLSGQLELSKLSSALSEAENALIQPDADYAGIKASLDSLAIPTEIETVEFPKLPIYPSKDSIDLASLELLGAGTFSSEKEEQLKYSVFAWQISNLDVKAEITEKKADFDDGTSKTIATIVNLQLNSINSAPKMFLALSLGIPFSQIVSMTNYGMQNLDGSAGFVFEQQNNEILLAVPGEIDIKNIKISASPDFSKIEILETYCGNEKCEPEQGENYKNCLEDCNPAITAIKLIAIIIIATAVLIFLIWKFYAVWYERRMIARFFKSRQDLISIIYYSTQAYKSGKKDKEIKEQLKKAGWKNEQIAFALSKVKKKLRIREEKPKMAGR